MILTSRRTLAVAGGRYSSLLAATATVSRWCDPRPSAPHIRAGTTASRVARIHPFRRRPAVGGGSASASLHSSTETRRGDVGLGIGTEIDCCVDVRETAGAADPFALGGASAVACSQGDWIMMRAVSPACRSGARPRDRCGWIEARPRRVAVAEHVERRPRDGAAAVGASAACLEDEVAAIGQRNGQRHRVWRGRDRPLARRHLFALGVPRVEAVAFGAPDAGPLDLRQRHVNRPRLRVAAGPRARCLRLQPILL